MKNEKPLSIHTIVVASILSMFLFFGGFAVLTTSGVVGNPFIPAVMGDEDEGEGDEKSDEDENENKEDDEEDEKDNKKEQEKKKEKEQEKKKEKEKETEKKKSSTVKSVSSAASTGVGDYKDDDKDEKDENEEEDDEKDGMTEEENEKDNNEEENEKDEILKEAREKVMKAEEEILEGMKEGMDATVALGKIAAAKSILNSIQEAIAAGNLEEAKRLAREVKKTVYLAKEEDFHSAEKSAERLKDATKKFVKAQSKVALLASLGGDTTTLAAKLAEAEKLLEEGRTTLSAGDYTAAEFSLRQAKVAANRVKDMAETAIYALGGSDDEFDEDHEEFAKEFSDDLDEIAEIETDRDRAKNLKEIIAKQKSSGFAVASAVQAAQGRSALARFFLGSDDDSIELIAEKIAENTKNVQSLRILAQSSGDEDIRKLLEEQAERIEMENTKLQAFVSAQANSNGLFGWFVDLFR